jgi:S1-C subfamily serine protease
MLKPVALHNLVWLFIGLLAVSCNTSPTATASSEPGDKNVVNPNDVKGVNTKEIAVKELEKHLQAGSFLEVIQDIASLKLKNEVETDKLLIFEEQALKGLTEEFNKKAEAKDYFELYRLYSILNNFTNQNLITGWSEKQILFSWAKEMEEKGNHLSAQTYYLKLIEKNLLTKAEWQSLIDYASRNNFVNFLKTMITKSGSVGLDIEQKLLEQVKQYSLPAQMLKGTVTVWIDKGIKLEGGIGFPDRVLGSGFFIDKRGYMLTNYHVIESEVDPEYDGFSRLYVRLPKNIDEKIPAKVIGWDKVFDVALLKVEVEPEYFFQILADINCEPGDKVYAIGSPIDPLLESTITSGIISAINRRHFLQLGDVVQIDAPVNPGNSGGPLLDEKGNFLGIVFGGLKPLEGLNFAIAANWIKKLLPALYRGGKIQHAWLGMSLTENENKLEVAYTLPGESAERGGIKSGDILVAINDKIYTSIRDVQEGLLDYPVNGLVKITWFHEGQKLTSLFVLKERPFRPLELALKRDNRTNVFVPLFGMELKYVDQFLWEKNYVVQKVITGSIADNTGISVNDPVNLQKWKVDDEMGVAILQLFIKKKTEGFIQSVIQLASYLETDEFI